MNRAVGGFSTKNQGAYRPRDHHSRGSAPRADEARLAAAAQARKELEDLFSGNSADSNSSSSHFGDQISTSSRVERTRITIAKSPQRAAEAQTEHVGGVAVTHKRSTMGGANMDSPKQAAHVESALAPESKLPASDTTRQGRTHTIIKTFAAAGPQSSRKIDAPAWDGAVEASVEGDAHKPFGTNTLRNVDWPNPRVATDLNSTRARLNHMEPAQALAWLLLSTRSDLKPLSTEEVDERIKELLAQTPREHFTEVKPCSYWVVDPLSEIAFNPAGACERVRPVNGEGHYIHAHHLPGGIGAWVTPQRLSSAESARKPAQAQRINAISLAGLLIASDRFDVLERVEPLDIDPLKPAAILGFDRNDLNKSRNGFDVGEINGYAVGLLAHAHHFFQWINPWQELLKENIGLRRNELTASLGLGLKTWSMAHGELSQACAEMVCAMLQLGAMINEAGLAALCAQAVKSSGKAKPASGFARLCALMFLVDRQGVAAQRVLQSARAGGFSVMPQHGHPHPMVPYAQANLEEAVALLMREGVDPSITDSSGKNVLQRAQSTRADRVVMLLQTGQVPQPAPAAQAPFASDRSNEAEVANVTGQQAPAQSAFIESAAQTPTISAQEESDMLDLVHALEGEIVAMRGMSQSLSDMMRRDVSPSLSAPLESMPVSTDMAHTKAEAQAQAQAQAQAISIESRDLATTDVYKTASMRDLEPSELPDKIIAQNQDAAPRPLAVKSRVKPAARRQAAIEALRAEFEKSKGHA